MATATSITINLEGVGRILMNHNVGVPIYQRSYAWEEQNVTDLFNDIQTASAAGAHEYFIGSIVTTKNQEARAEVADGQQRLATVTILLAAIRDYFYENNDKDRSDTITAELLHKKELKTLNLIPKLSLNDLDNEYFTKRVLFLPNDPQRSGSPTKPSHKRIDRAAFLARDHVKKIASLTNPTDQLADLVEYLKDSVKVIWVQVPDDTNAFMIFETLNDRGLTLAITDLLKNHLFGLAGPRLGEVRESWIRMTSILEAIEEDDIVLTFLRHYWSSCYGLVREKDLYADIKKRISTQSLAVNFTRDLVQNAHKYAAIVSPSDAFWNKYGDTCRKHLDTLNTLRMVQIRPLILSVLDVFNEAEVKKTIRNLVSWSVRLLIHGSLGTGAIEANTCRAALAIRSKSVSNAAKLFISLKKIIPNDAQFKSAFMVASVSKAFLARYYLRALERQQQGDNEPELVPNDSSEVINLEHILPQNPSAAWAHIPSDDKELLVNRLGNLALLKTKINSKTGNDGFTIKKKYYAKSGFALTSSLSKEKKWDKSEIETRQARMAALALKTWPVK